MIEKGERFKGKGQNKRKGKGERGKGKGQGRTAGPPVAAGLGMRQDLCERSLRFSEEILALNRRLLPQKERFAGTLFQLVRAGTGIGSNVEEAQAASSRKDMAAKYAIALRESREARYWLRVLRSDPVVGSSVDPLIAEATEWVAMLTTIVKKLRE